MKRFSFVSCILMAVFAVSNCSKEADIAKDELVSESGVPFEIVASSASTRTVNDGMNTKWAADDEVSVFHAPAGGAYVSDGAFSIKDIDTGLFDGTISSSPVEGDKYDWIAVYPYSSYLKTVENESGAYYYFGGRSDRSQTQAATNSTAHLGGSNLPMFGTVKAAEYTGEAPFIQMNHLAAIVAINITNGTSADINVATIEFTAPVDIVGSYYIHFNGETPTYSAYNTYQSNTATLEVTDGTLAKDATGKFYIVLKPFTATNGQTISVKVTTAAGDSQTKEFSITSDVAFSAGKIKNVKMNFTKEHEVDEPEDFVMIESINDVTDGTYLIVNFDPVNEDESFILKNETLTSKTQSAVMLKNVTDLTLSEDAKTITTSANSVKWEFTSAGSGTFKIKSGAKDSEDYLLCKDENAGLIISTWNWTSLQNVWTVTEYTSGDEKYFNLSTTTGTKTRYLETYLSGPDWRTYTSPTQAYNSIKLYRKGGAIVKTPLAKPTNVVATLNTDDPDVVNTVDVSWNAVENAGSYVVTAAPGTGTALTKTTSSTTATFTDLAYETEYTITVVAKPSDINTYSDSPASDPVTVETGALEGVNTTTFTVGTEIVSIFPATKDGIKFEYEQGTSTNPPTYYKPFRWYKNSTVTISGGDAVIKSIAFDIDDEYPGSLTADSGSISDGTWTGSASTVVFTNGGSQARFTSVVITYEGTGTQTVVTSTPSVAIEATSSSIEVGKTTATTVTSNSPSTGITYSSSAPDVATVNENGVVTAVSAGTAIITVTVSRFENEFSIINGASGQVEITVTPSSDDTIASISFGSASGSTNINAATVTGKDSQNNTWTITTEGTTSFSPNSAYAQVGSSSKPASSITFATTLPDTVTEVKSLSIKMGGFNGTAGTITLKVDDTVVGSGSLNATNDVTVSSSAAANGNTITITVTNIAKGVKVYNITAKYR